jgi:hypothetical protein
VGEQSALERRKERERREADGLKATATGLSLTVLRRTTIAACSAAIRSVAADSGRGAAEPSADMRAIRTDAGVMAALNYDLTLAQRQTFFLILDALVLGYRTEAEGQVAELKGVSLSVTLTESDRRELADYPIVGGSNPPKAYTAPEIARDLIGRLRQEIEGTLAAPVAGKADPEELPVALGGVAQAHADRVGSAVAEAYFAGVQAGLLAVGAALVGR